SYSSRNGCCCRSLAGCTSTASRISAASSMSTRCCSRASRSSRSKTRGCRRPSGFSRPRNREEPPALRAARLPDMKIASVVHRFGAEIAGGSEGHCRAIAERLAARHDVTVVTTCAKDHISWKNEYPEGRSELGRVRIERFVVAKTRSLHRFADLSEVVF